MRPVTRALWPMDSNGIGRANRIARLPLRGTSMKFEISGTTMQTVAIDLDPGETVYSQSSMMAWMNDQITMDTNTGGGFLSGLKRSMSGGGMFVTDFTARGRGHVAFASRFPGTLLAKTLSAGESVVCRKETFLCAQKSVTFEIAWQQKFGAGLL